MVLRSGVFPDTSSVGVYGRQVISNAEKHEPVGEKEIYSMALSKAFVLKETVLR